MGDAGIALVVYASHHTLSFASSAVSPEVPIADPHLAPPCGEGCPPANPDFVHFRRDHGDHEMEPWA